MMPVSQHFQSKLIPYQDSVTITFDRRADMDLSGIYDILVFGYENTDDYLLNDTLMVQVENTEIEESVNIFPNPFTDKLNIIINSKINRSVRISMTNVSGKVVFTENLELAEGENDIFIYTYQLSPGLYILNINGANYTKAYSLIKLKQ
jgi:hypothetical protein